MKKRILAIGLITTMLVLSGCGNKTLIDTKFVYNKAIIDLGDKIITVNVKSWRDYEGEQIQVIAEDGTIYLTSSFRCVLIKDSENK